MCGIIATLATHTNLTPFLVANATRGRDSYGIWIDGNFHRQTHGFKPVKPIYCSEAALANMRAEPTTEWVHSKTLNDVQPFAVGDWIVVHNGTIANDKELCRQHSFVPPTRIDSWVIAALLDRYNNFNEVIHRLVGSFAICAINRYRPGTIYYAMNYRPLYLHKDRTLSSVALSETDRLLPPYSIGTLTSAGIVIQPLRPRIEQDKALVVCSGGLDSTVAATALIRAGMHVELLHFQYGCRASHAEAKSISAIANALDTKVHFVHTPIFTDIIKGSPLTNTARNERFAESEAGAEYAHEWVPARNLIMLGIATGIAESWGFNVLALGANLEEAGAYPDNEPEFYNRYSQLLPFAVRDGVQMRLEMPVGNLMKHEIVKLGIELNAPLHLTWSCYNDGLKHCGSCGPCFMRHVAFEMNGAKDPVFE